MGGLKNHSHFNKCSVQSLLRKIYNKNVLLGMIMYNVSLNIEKECTMTTNLHLSNLIKKLAPRQSFKTTVWYCFDVDCKSYTVKGSLQTSFHLKDKSSSIYNRTSSKWYFY